MSSHRNLQLSKIPSYDLVWIVSYTTLTRVESKKEEEEIMKKKMNKASGNIFLKREEKNLFI